VIVVATRYELGAEIGRGALGRVVKVVDLETGAVLAGKLLHASNRDDEGARERFAREAALLARLDHPNVVRVHGLVEEDGEPLLLMELVPGKSLARVVAEETTLPEARIVAIGRGVAAGLAAAHRAGLVHRDLKPANILLAPGDLPKIVDFGLARATSFAGVDRKRFALVGTPDYMAPESIDPLAVDPRSDLYALGCILFELAAGRPPFSGATAFALLEAHRRAEVPEVPGVSRGLERLVRALLAKSPADRPQSAGAVEQALAELTALAPAAVAPAALVAGRCASCGAPLVGRVAVCFDCGRPPVLLEPGPMSVVVTGPGEIAHKLDYELRGRLLAWIQDNPQLGLDPRPLEKAVPRLPFVLARGLSPEAARRLADSVAALGLTVELGGSPHAIASLRQKAAKLAGRSAIIGAGFFAWGIHMVHRVPLLLVALILLPLFFAARGYRRAVAPVALPVGKAPPALPPAVRASVGRVVDVVPAIAERRHREGLRAVVQRVLALHEQLPDADGELAAILDRATAAALRVDELERRLQAADLREGGAEVRRELVERDAWAARLLDAAAQLDALRARSAAARARGATRELDDALAALRAEVAAFEEVQKL
jgi:hypothetical protein